MRKFLLPRMLWMAFALSLVAIEPGLAHADTADIAAGKRAFAKCAQCHAVGPSARGAYGPQLNGIVGRPAASTTDFKYSPAMTKSGIIWTESKLSAFIKSPDDVVPGTRMSFWGIGNEQERTNLIAYLRTLSK